MKAIFETVEGAIFIREVKEAIPVIRFPIYNGRNIAAIVGHEYSGGMVRHIERRYEIVERCRTLALYQEVVE